MNFIIYTDGGCSGNKRDAGCKGGYAYIILNPSGKPITEGFGKGFNTTNNQMEMTAVIEGIMSLIEELKYNWGGPKKHSCEVRTDSRYIIDNYYDYLQDWKKNGWRKAKGGSVLNKEYWKAIDELTPGFKSFKFTWVKGHNKDKYNNLVDSMAKSRFMT